MPKFSAERAASFRDHAATLAAGHLGQPLSSQPGKAQRQTMPASPQKITAEWRNRIETTVQEITDQMELARHAARARARARASMSELPSRP
jgi:hypothetical protein